MVSIAIISTLAYVLIEAIGYVQEAAEKTAMERTVSAIEFGLRYEAASRRASGREGEIPGLAKANPVQWLERPPQNYLGELAEDPGPKAPRGAWYFDTRKKELVYRINRGDRFRSGKDGRKEVRWRVVIEGADAHGGVALVPLVSYGWF